MTEVNSSRNEFDVWSESEKGSGREFHRDHSGGPEVGISNRRRTWTPKRIILCLLNSFPRMGTVVPHPGHAKSKSDFRVWKVKIKDE